MTKQLTAFTVLAAGALLLIAASPAKAEYAGPGATAAVSTVEQILKKPVDDKDVTLKGKLIKKVGNEKYTFSDGTGEIRVEIDAEDFPKVAVDDKTTIQITGEVEKDFMESPEIDVDAVTVVQ